MNEPASPLATAGHAAPPPAALANQPIERVISDGVEYVLLGTAHVSRASVAAVEAMVAAEPFDAVAIELCDSRAQGMRNPEAFKQMDLFQVIRQRKTGMVIASLALASFQKRIAEQYGIEPGAEMKAAMLAAEQAATPLWLVDRDVGVTLKRAWRGVGFREKLGILGSLVASVIEREDVSEEDIEKLKQGDMLESAFGEFAKSSWSLYTALIDERDAYMAASLREHAARSPLIRRVLVVVGAGHLKGLCQRLRAPVNGTDPTTAELDRVPPPARWPKWLALGVVLAVFAAIAVAFLRSPSLGANALRDWVLFTGGLAALGALLAGGHPLSMLTSFVAAPLKPFRPGIPTGAVGALTEVWVRKPRVGDFDTLRSDVTRWQGWWSNRVARTLLVFMLVNFGTIAGEYIAGIHIVKSLL